MSPIQQTILEKLQALPPEKQGEVLNFIESLQEKSPPNQSRSVLRGIWADFDEITEADIAEVRQEMWSNFPRENIE